MNCNVRMNSLLIHKTPTPGERDFETESVYAVIATMEPRRVMCKACQDKNRTGNCSNSNEITITPVGKLPIKYIFGQRSLGY